MRRWFCLVFIVATFYGCEFWHDSPLDTSHSITVTNLTECYLVILLDQTDYFNLPEYENSDVFENVEEGNHELQAYRQDSFGTNTEIANISIYVSERKDYFWDITDCSTDE